ncbi:hypothetical protein U1Q18_013989 [Sarracenia purpurea var. burkii]
MRRRRRGDRRKQSRPARPRRSFPSPPPATGATRRVFRKLPAKKMVVCKRNFRCTGLGSVVARAMHQIFGGANRGFQGIVFVCFGNRA